MKTELDLREKFDRQALVFELERAGAGIGYNGSVHCPWHKDAKPSGSIFQKDDQSWAYKCHSCDWHGDVFDVREQLTGNPAIPKVKPIIPAIPPPPETSSPEEGKSLQNIRDFFRQSCAVLIEYAYSPMFVVFRLEDSAGGKTFKQAHTVDGVSWICKAPPKPWPLFGRIIEGKSILVVEGEKKVQALTEIGIPAVTSPCGAGKAEHADWSSLAGMQVILWPDNDDKGKEHMADVAKILERINCDVYRINIEAQNWPAKWDVVNVLGDIFEVDPDRQRQAQIELVHRLVTTAKPVDRFTERVVNIATGVIRNVDFPWVKLSALSKALMPGTLTILCGGPGSGKSFFLLQALRFWHSLKIPACVYELEEDREFHLLRMLAQVQHNPRLLDDTWCRANQALFLKAHDDRRALMREMRSHIYDSRDFSDKLSDLSDWVNQKAKDGYRIICIDPITVAIKSERSWEDDLAFVRAVGKIAVERKVSVVLVSHPRPGAKNNGLDDLAGGASYQRLSQTVILLKRLPSAESRTLTTLHEGDQELQVNYIVEIAKARLGSGHGRKLGFWMEALNYEERGVCK